MKKKQFVIAITFICVALVFQACPVGPSPDYKDTCFSGVVGSAAVVTMEDTIEVHYRDYQGVFRTKDLLPSQYTQSVEWQELSVDEENLSEEQRQKRQLMVKKRTNRGTSYVLHGTGAIINGENASWYYVWRDPADSVNTYFQNGKTVTQTIPMYPEPCELGLVIKALIEQYPDRITVLDDTDEHHIGYLEQGGDNATCLTIP